jgi:RimJ/RimL family protein N-acetyltransferase
MLRDGFSAGAVVDEKLVAIANVSVLTRRFGELAVATLEPWRRRGFATGAASLVVSWILDSGRTAVWSCGEHNQASIAAARKLGFRDAGRRAYVVLSEGG